MSAALKGIRVLDLSRILAGPWSTQLLADFGADVIKVERPGVGDDTRGWGPPFLAREDGSSTVESAYFLAANRGKRSLTVDIASEQGRDIVQALARSADVFIENYKTGDMQRYGLDYATLSQINPRLVYCSITGFGQTGPYSGRPGYDFVIQAMGGLMSITGNPSGEPGGGPMKCGVPISDMMTGMYATTAILSALHERATSGQGQYIDMSLLDVQIAWLANQASNYLVSGAAPQALGNAHPNLAPYQTFPVSDGDIIIAVGNDRQFQALCAALGATALAQDARMQKNSGRITHRHDLIEAINALTRRHTKQELLRTLTEAGVPVGPVNSIPEALSDEHVRSREMLITLEHSSGARAPLVGNPVKFSRSRVEYRRAPPALGEHTEQILMQELGWARGGVDAARAAGVV